MKKTYNPFVFLSLIALFIYACNPYSKVKPQKLQQFYEENTIEAINLNDFNIYTFNICEYYSEKYNGTNRFVPCPNNFHEVSANDSIKKVEEIYFLKHKTSDLVMYLTTASRKYIKNQKGFLNDQKLYKDKLYLQDIDYIYVGKITNTNDSIIYNNQKNSSKIIWHLLEPITNQATIKIEEVNIETVENTTKFDEKIELNQVFSIPFNFEKSEYILYNETSEIKSLPIDKLFFINTRKHKTEVIFEIADSIAYRYSTKRVLYFTKE